MVDGIVEKIVDCFKRGGKLIWIGNGGSATMASHAAGEFIGKFEMVRPPLPAITLFDLSSITAIGNDLGYNFVFSRPLQVLGKPGDLLIVLSTSGQSTNCLQAISMAEVFKIDVIDWPRDGNSTAEIQENQLKQIHEVVRQVERRMFP